MADPAEPDAALDGFPIAAENVAARDSLEVIASRFADEVRRGLRPSVADYLIRYRQLADELRDFLPVVEALERWKYDKEAECVRQNLPESLPFRRLGEYTLLRELGRGGTGVVFEGIEPRTERRVAVKLLPWRYLSDLPRRKERFQREAATIARLRHPNIVPVYTFGEHEGYCYYVMQLVDGVSLDRVIRRLREAAAVVAGEVHAGGLESRDPLPPHTVPADRALRRDSWIGFAHMGVQVGFALMHAHTRGVLHNDVKPANLILDHAGRVVVTDFGGGRPADPGVAELDDAPVGTLKYLAPERLGGQCDERSDVYSLGVTLYELITQIAAFDAVERRGLIDQVLNPAFRRPRAINPQIPLPLETIVLKAMSLRPEDRYPTARALALDLMRFVNGQPIEAPLPSLLERARRWMGDR